MIEYPKICQVTFEEAQAAHMRWNGKHKGVTWEVSYWGVGQFNDGHGMWNRYIFIPEEMIPDEFDQFWLPPYEWGITETKHISYRYEDTKLADLEWNGGATFYEKKGGIDGQPRLIKIGCDYGHVWDAEQGYPYSLSHVRHDAMITCWAFRKMFPASLYRCSHNGKWYPRDEMRDHPNPDSDCQWWVGNRDKVPAAWIGEAERAGE